MLNRKESFLNGKVSGRFARYTAMVLAFATAIAGFELGSIHAPQAIIQLQLMSARICI